MMAVIDTFSDPADALRAAVKRVGSQAAMGRLLGVTQQAVGRWLDKGKPLPAEAVLVVEEATGISRHELRPDVYPREGTAETESTDASTEPDLFARFGGVASMADTLGQTVASVLRWRQDRRIPSEQQQLILRRAAELNLGITAEDVIFPFPEDRNA